MYTHKSFKHKIIVLSPLLILYTSTQQHFQCNNSCNMPDTTYPQAENISKSG